MSRSSAQIGWNLFAVAGTIFLLSQAVGIWAAADRIAAVWQIAPLFIATVSVLALAGIEPIRAAVAWRLSAYASSRRIVGLVSAALAGSLAMLFMLVGRPNGEVTAGALIGLLPLGAGALFPGGEMPGQAHHRWPTVVALTVGIIGLVFTLERSAWVALGAGVGAAGICHLWWLQHDRADTRMHRARGWIGAALLVGALVLILLNFQRPLLSSLDQSPYSRLTIWQDTHRLLGDYRFSGIGIGQTAMTLSTYVYLFHVPFLAQTYNLYLQIGIELGVPGLIGFLGMVGSSFWLLSTASRITTDTRLHHWRLAALAALAALLTHGLVDAGLFTSRYVAWIVLVPMGFIVVLSAIPFQYQNRRQPLDYAGQSALPQRAWQRLGALLLPTLPILAVGSLFVLPGSVAALYANMGAVAQARAELGAYSWPAWQIQDELRRSDVIDLAPAIMLFERALARDPDNVTSHRRLGQIALSLGNVEDAAKHLEAAYRRDSASRVLAQLLGELYAIRGETGRALDIWRAADVDWHKLELREWWYRHLAATLEAQRLSKAVAQFK